jgi:protein-tyrosine phosphatase
MTNFWRQLFGSQVPSASDGLSALPPLGALGADMHSHLLPGLDDGAETLAHSLDLLRELRSMGFRKLADIVLECAAEYYLDEWLGHKLANGTELLSFGGDKRYLLIETSYLNEPFNLQSTIFELQAAGYRPVLAHPERYVYLYGHFDVLEKLRHESGVLLQLNLNSLAGYYSPAARKVAEKLIDARLVDFVGTDTHHLRHTTMLAEKTQHLPYFRKLLALPLLNNTL